MEMQEIAPYVTVIGGLSAFAYATFQAVVKYYESAHPGKGKRRRTK